MKKIFISANELLIDSYKLAQSIIDQGFRPDFIVGIWRGGAPVGIAVQEYLDYAGVCTDHIAIRTSSYFGINQQSKEIRVHAMDYLLKNICAEQNLLIIDDVFDSGRSIKAVLKRLSENVPPDQYPRSVKVACPWYKPKRNITDITPDFYLHTTDDWLVFPHELKGLTIDEIREHKGESIANLLSTATVP